MSPAVKFTFDTHFDDGAPSAVAADSRSRKSYSAEEIAALCESARQDGLADGNTRALQALSASTGQLAAAILRAIEVMDGEIEAIRAEAAALAVAAAKKLAGAALGAAPEAEIVEALHAALHQAVGEPRVVVKTSPALAHRIQDRVAEIAAHEGFEGRLQFVPDAALSGADCHIEWRRGGIERIQSMIENALTDLVARRFPAYGTVPKDGE